MSIVLIPRALEKHLGALTPSLPIAGENGTYTPVTGTAYQATAVIPANTQSPTLAAGYVIETGIFQVMVCYPSAIGPVQARTRAELIRNHFVSRTRLVEGAVNVEIFGKPSIGAPLTPTGWYCIPVRINYKAVIQS